MSLVSYAVADASISQSDLITSPTSSTTSSATSSAARPERETPAPSPSSSPTSSPPKLLGERSRLQRHHHGHGGAAAAGSARESAATVRAGPVAREAREDEKGERVPVHREAVERQNVSFSGF